jgi:hypothetical protein
MVKIVEESFKVATKKYYDKNKTILPGSIYFKEVIKLDNQEKVYIKRNYICSLEETLKNKVYKKLNESQLDLFNKLNNFNVG